jgi:hypothetical protein
LPVEVTILADVTFVGMWLLLSAGPQGGDDD